MRRNPPEIELLHDKELTIMWKRALIALLVPLLFLVASRPAKGQSQEGGLPSYGGDIAGAAVGAGAAIAITVYIVHSKHTLKGCAVSSADGLRLVNESNKQGYALTGDTAGIKAGDSVKLSGKKMRMKGDPSHRQFVVTKLSKDYGACKL
jgi:hypothetical protein